MPHPKAPHSHHNKLTARVASRYSMGDEDAVRIPVPVVALWGSNELGMDRAIKHVFLTESSYRRGSYTVHFPFHTEYRVDTFLEMDPDDTSVDSNGARIKNVGEIQDAIRIVLANIKHDVPIPPEADGVLASARDLRVAAASGNPMRVRRAMVDLLTAMSPFCDYLGESDVTARFRLLARDLASRG